jgi:protein-L-isoaspartate(D-aspartate) O-methyltransferase
MSAGDVYAKARFNMVEGQIRTNKVTDERLIAALSEVPRQIFVPNTLSSVAYVDTSIRIAGDRYMIEPLVVARLLQEAGVGESDKALVVGAGSGYSAAILAKICASVAVLESDAELAAAARENLAALGLANAAVHTGPLDEGWGTDAPYDVILIDGMIAELPDALTAQLADRGRLVTVRAQEGRSGAGTLFRKLSGTVSSRPLFDAVVPFLPGFAPRPAFAF